MADETTARVGVTASPATSSPQASVTGRASARPVAPAPGGRRGTGSALRKRLEIAFFVAPALLLFLFFVVVPIIRAVQLSAYRWKGYGPLVDFVGLKNYVSVLQNDVFIGALQHNLIIVVASIAIQLPLGLAIALLLNRKMWGQGVLRTIIFVPYVLAEVIAGVVWFQLLQPKYGVIDAMLDAVGLSGPEQGFLGTPEYALWTVIVVLTWKYLGLAVILFLAGLQSVPEELYEAVADRRRQLVADAAQDHAPAARPDHPHLGVPVDDRLAPALRHGLDPHRRRPGQRDHDHGDLPHQRGHQAAELRDRRERPP